MSLIENVANYTYMYSTTWHIFEPINLFFSTDEWGVLIRDDILHGHVQYIYMWSRGLKLLVILWVFRVRLEFPVFIVDARMLT